LMNNYFLLILFINFNRTYGFQVAFPNDLLVITISILTAILGFIFCLGLSYI